ncbi:ATP-binding protein [Kitasatospora sp. NPDC097643]|uniref:ATP-binding protein n=1 Tax=Kitasatospora sp. NPDC097643 TaxID=3157230 RepID=UPI00331AD2C5
MVRALRAECHHEAVIEGFRGHVRTNDPTLLRGWPLERPFTDDPDEVLATVVAPDARIFGQAPAIKLQAPEAAAGKRLPGLSGGPVLHWSHRGAGIGTEAAVGVVRWNPPRPDGSALGGALYATPVHAVTERWPQLRPLVPPERSLPATSKIDQFLTDQLGTADGHLPFGGRAGELDRLDSWLHAPDGPACLLVTAPSGAGKSTLLARWWHRLNRTPPDGTSSVFVPVSARYDLAGADSVLEAVVTRLAALHDHDPFAAVQGGIDNLRERLADYLALPAPRQGRLVLVLDGLDECLGWDVSPTLLRPATFGRGVRVAVAARQTEQRPDAAAWRDALGWPAADCLHLPLSPLTRNGVTDALDSLRPPLDAATRDRAGPILYRVTAGDALVLGLYLQELQNADDRSGWLTGLADLPAPHGLDGYMKRWWQTQESLWQGPLGARAPDVARVFNLLACALGPLRRRDLLGLARRFGLSSGDALDAALRDLGRWIITDTVPSRADAETFANPTYALSHPRLAEYRRHQLARDDELSRYDEAYLDWGRDTLASVRQDRENARHADPYPVRFYGAHLERAHTPTAQLVDLVDPGWSAAWELATEEFQGHLVDVRRAFRATETENDTRADAGRPALLLPEQIACRAAMLDASVSAALISPRLVAQLRRHGLWSDRQALAYVQSLASPYERSHALRTVAPQLGAPATDHVAALAAALTGETKPEEAIDAAVGFVLHLAATGQTDRAAATAMALPPGWRAVAATELATVLTDRNQTEMMRTVLTDAAGAPEWQAPGFVRALAERIDRETAAAALEQDPARTALTYLGARPVPVTTPNDVLLQRPLLELVAPWIADADWPPISRTATAVLGAHAAVKTLQEQSRQARRETEHSIDQQDEDAARFHYDRALALVSSRKDWQVLAEPALALWTGLMPYEPDLSEQTASSITSMGVHNLAPTALTRLLSRLDGPAHETILTELCRCLTDDPQRANRRELLGVAAAAARTDFVMRFAAQHHGLPGLLEDVGAAAAQYLDTERLRELLARTRAADGEPQASLAAERPLLAALATHGPDQAAEALDLARVGSTANTTTAVLATALRTPPAPATDITATPAPEALHCAALMVAPASAITAEQTSDVLWTFQHRYFAVETLRALLPRIPGSELTTAELEEAVSRAIGLPGDHPELDDVLLDHLTRIAARDGGKGVRAAARRLSTLPPALPDALAAVAAARAECTVQYVPGAWAKARVRTNLGNAVQLEAARHEDPGKVLETEHVPHDVLEIDSRLGRLFLLAVPEDIRRIHLDLLLPSGLLDGESAFRKGDLWAVAVSRLLAAFSLEDLDRLLRFGRHTPWERWQHAEPVSPAGRGHLLAAAAVRYAELGRGETALELLPWIPNTADHSRALAGLAVALPAAALAHWAELVTAELGAAGPTAAGLRAVVWARAAGRWTELDPADRWKIVRSWLHHGQHADRDDLSADLLGLAPLLLSVGGAASGPRIVERLAHS